MDYTACRILLLPLEIRQKIYSLCLDDERPQPGLLQLNRSIHNEATQFLRKWNHTYSYIISAHGAGFDDSARWRFKVKHHIPRLSRMKHIIVNIQPPRLKMPLDMWNIWHHLQDFCKELAAQARIQRLTINFVETQTAKWETDGVPHASWNLGHFGKGIDTFDIGQLLIIFGHFVTNVAKPGLSIPGTYMLDFCDRFGDSWTDRIRECMTGRWGEDETVNDYYELMENQLQDHRSPVKQATGRRSMEVFRQLFGSSAILGFQDLKRFKEEWPYMDMEDSWAIDRPRYRVACHPCCQCGQTAVEVSMPNPYWSYQDMALAKDWHRDELFTWGKRSRCSNMKKFPIGEDTERIARERKVLARSRAWSLSAKSSWSISATSSESSFRSF